MAVSENELRRLASETPERLLALLRDPTTDIVTLTFGAEIAGRFINTNDTRDVLIVLLSHGDPVVREGAIYGLVHHLDDEICALLRFARDSDESPGVRAAAAEALSEPA
jgi:HEAT repeat protein